MGININRYLLAILIFLPHMASAIELMIPVEELRSYFANCKSHLTWDDSGFDPLKIDVIRTQVKDTMSEEDKGYLNAIKSFIKERGITGIVFGRGGLEGKILIGDHVFSPADELKFINELGEWTSINKERAVILLTITQEKGIFLVSGKKTSQEQADSEGVKFEMVWDEFFKY